MFAREHPVGHAPHGPAAKPRPGPHGLKKEGLPQDGLNAPAEALSAGSEGEVIFGGCGLIGQDGLLHDTLSLRETQLLTLLLGPFPGPAPHLGGGRFHPACEGALRKLDKGPGHRQRWWAGR